MTAYLKKKYLQEVIIFLLIDLYSCTFNFLSFQKRKWFTFLIFFVFHTFLSHFTNGPSGRVGRLGARPCFRPWAGPFAPALAGLLFAAGRLALRAADLACVCCRVDYAAAGRTARAAAPRDWAAAAQAAQVWPPGEGLT
jgi:hypothetical protein